MRQRRLRAEERAEQIDLDDAPPRVRAHRLRRDVEIPGGVVHQQVESPMLFRDAGEDGSRALGITYVERDGGCLTTGLSQPIGGWFHMLGATTREHDVHPER